MVQHYLNTAAIFLAVVTICIKLLGSYTQFSFSTCSDEKLECRSDTARVPKSAAYEHKNSAAPVALATVTAITEAPKSAAASLSFSRATDVEVAYINKFADCAIAEYKIFKVPAAIKLAQALIESDRGRSGLASKHKNHFGIKWHKKLGNSNGLAVDKVKTSTGTYRTYTSDWFSFRDHSYFLQRAHYTPIYNKCGVNYRCWAYRLKAKGYAEDPAYAEKLIRMVERLELYKLDGLLYKLKTTDK